jgi:glycosyltransferase involved in cell wall biosynthesis
MDQTYEPMEVIVVDDGSTDGTDEILRGYRERLIHVRQANAGRSVARNTGLALATGEYVLFLDSDDTLEPDHLASLVDVMDRGGEDLAYCKADAFFSSQPHMRYAYHHAYYDGRLADRLLLGNFINMHCGLVRRRFLLEHGIVFMAGREYSEDWEFWCRVVLHGARVRRLDRVLAHIRDHERNTSRNMIRMYTEFLEILNLLERELPTQLGIEPRRRLVASARVRTLFQMGAVHVFLGNRREGVVLLGRSLHRFWLPVIVLVALLRLPLPVAATRMVFGQHCATQQRVQLSIESGM